MNKKLVRSLGGLALSTSLIFASVSANAAATVPADDPWEGFNRAMFSFNDTLDTYALKPVAKGYRAVTPDPVKKGVSNIFRNLGELRNIFNSLLQFEGSDALVSTGRFLTNTTIGLLGTFDVASGMGMDYRYSDFGLTLSNWNVPSGPYVVLPVFGPQTVRSSAGLWPDTQLNPVAHLNPERDRWIVTGVDLLDTRAQLLNQESLLVGDKYVFIRDAYIQRRNFLITGELPEDDF